VVVIHKADTKEGAHNTNNTPAYENMILLEHHNINTTRLWRLAAMSKLQTLEAHVARFL
jgi:hypothetical protein